MATEKESVSSDTESTHQSDELAKSDAKLEDEELENLASDEIAENKDQIAHKECDKCPLKIQLTLSLFAKLAPKAVSECRFSGTFLLN